MMKFNLKCTYNRIQVLKFDQIVVRDVVIRVFCRVKMILVRENMLKDYSNINNNVWIIIFFLYKFNILS